MLRILGRCYCQNQPTSWRTWAHLYSHTGGQYSFCSMCFLLVLCIQYTALPYSSFSCSRLLVLLWHGGTGMRKTPPSTSTASCSCHTIALLSTQYMYIIYRYVHVYSYNGVGRLISQLWLAMVTYLYRKSFLLSVVLYCKMKKCTSLVRRLWRAGRSECCACFRSSRATRLGERGRISVLWDNLERARWTWVSGTFNCERMLVSVADKRAAKTA